MCGCVCLCVAVSACVWLCVSVSGCVGFFFFFFFFFFFAGWVCLCVAVLCVAVWLCVDGSISLDILNGDPTVAVVANVRFETSI